MTETTELPITDIKTLAENKLKSMVSDGIIANAVNTGVEKAVTESIASAFRYGKLSKILDEALREGLNLNMKDVPFEIYNKQMAVAVAGKLGGFFKEAAQNQFMEELGELLSPAPTEISIRKVAETIVSCWKTDEPWDADHLSDNATVELTENEYGGWSMEIYKKYDSNSRHQRADVRLYFISDRDNEDQGILRIDHNMAFNPTCFDEFEGFIFKLYCAKTKITGFTSDDIDPDYWELTLKDYQD